jgi:hypothetical protein
VPRHIARLVVDYSASCRLVVDYFTYAARLGASARRAARRAAYRRLLRLRARPGASARRAARHVARRRLLRLRCAFGCLGMLRGTSRSPSRGSSSTTSPTPRVRVPREVVWLVAPLVVDYFAYAVRPGASAHRAARHAAHRRLLCAPRLRLAATLALLQPRRASRLLVSWQHWIYFEYATRRRNIIFQSHRVDYSSRLVFQTSQERQSHPQQLIGINYV